jgi:hypothetical protein
MLMWCIYLNIYSNSRLVFAINELQIRKNEELYLPGYNAV